MYCSQLRPNFKPGFRIKQGSAKQWERGDLTSFTRICIIPLSSWRRPGLNPFRVKENQRVLRFIAAFGRTMRDAIRVFVCHCLTHFLRGPEKISSTDYGRCNTLRWILFGFGHLSGYIFLGIYFVARHTRGWVIIIHYVCLIWSISTGKILLLKPNVGNFVDKL